MCPRGSQMELMALCQRYSDGAVQLQYVTMFTGVCKPKGAQTYRSLWITPGTPSVAGVAVAQAAPVTTMMVTCPDGSKAGDSIQICYLAYRVARLRRFSSVDYAVHVSAISLICWLLMQFTLNFCVNRGIHLQIGGSSLDGMPSRAPMTKVEYNPRFLPLKKCLFSSCTNR